MKANVNYNLKGDEEPGVQGKAQRPSLPYPGHILSILAAPCHSAKTSVFTQFLQHWHPLGNLGGRYLPSLVPPCQLHLNLEPKLDSICHHFSNF